MASFAVEEQINGYQHQVALDAYMGGLSPAEQAFRSDMKMCVYEQALCGAAGDIAYGASPAQAAAFAQQLCAQDNSMCDVGATYPDPTLSAIQDQIVMTVVTLGAGTLIKAGTSAAIDAVSGILRGGGEEAAAAIPARAAVALSGEPAAARAVAATVGRAQETGAGAARFVVDSEGGATDLGSRMSTSARPVVIGESMDARVIPAARDLGADWYAPPTFSNAAQSMAYNSYWINEMMNQGRGIIDIGPASPLSEPWRLAYPEPTSPWFAMERGQIMQRGYGYYMQYPWDW